MKFLKKYLKKYSEDLSKFVLEKTYPAEIFNGDVLYIHMATTMLKIVYLTKSSFIVYLKYKEQNQYKVTIYFKPHQLNEVKFYINNLNKKL